MQAIHWEGLRLSTVLMGVQQWPRVSPAYAQTATGWLPTGGSAAVADHGTLAEEAEVIAGDRVPPVAVHAEVVVEALTMPKTWLEPTQLHNTPRGTPPFWEPRPAHFLRG